jgi:hypothetical protein
MSQLDKVSKMIRKAMFIWKVIPCVVMSWASDDTILSLVGGFCVGNVDWELNLEELHCLLPFHLALELHV